MWKSRYDTCYAQIRSFLGSLHSPSVKSLIDSHEAAEAMIASCASRILLTKRTIREANIKLRSTQSIFKSMEAEVTYMRSKISDSVSEDHPAGDLFTEPKDLPLPLTYTEVLYLLGRPDPMLMEPRKGPWSLPPLIEVSECGTARRERSLIHFCVALTGALMRVTQARLRTYLFVVRQRLISKESRAQLGELKIFLRSIRVRSVREAWTRIAGYGPDKQTPVSVLRSQDFVQSLKLLGFEGDGVRVATFFDRRNAGSILYSDFLECLSG